MLQAVAITKAPQARDRGNVEKICLKATLELRAARGAEDEIRQERARSRGRPPQDTVAPSEVVARVLDQGKERRRFLQKSLRTKDRKEAIRLAPAVLVRFQKTLEEAEALLAERPLRTSLAQSEIDRIAEFHFAASLAGDEEFTREGGGGDDELLRGIARQLDEAGIDYSMPIPIDAQRPAYGLSNREVAKRNADLEFMLPLSTRRFSSIL
jgi:hypothetical protein